MLTGPSDLLKKKQLQEVKQRPESYVKHLLDLMEQIGQGDISREPQLEEMIATRFGEVFEVVEIEKAGGVKEKQIRSKPGHSFDVAAAAESLEKTAKRSVSLRRSALISLISACEWFSSQLLHLFFDRHPEAAGLGDKTLSYEELAKFGSVDDARQWLIANKIEEILRGSFIDWIKFFSERLRIDKSVLEEHIPYCHEACLRRNLLVHNGGVVNAIYLKRVPQDLLEGISEGQVVSVEESYYEDRLDRFEVVFSLIALEIWRKFDKGSDLRLSIGIQLGFDALKSKRWTVARAISKYISSQKGPESEQVMALVNYWQSFKWAGEFAKVEAEVIAWDVSAKGMEYQMAREGLNNPLCRPDCGIVAPAWRRFRAG
ncbi:hypothetical protein, partial [Lysobacter sp. N42]|uniref:hypothetical protein n=1 Tax=Lysobacter sp. N42 TaxID=2545719 RepID=UPI00104B707B